MFRWIVLLLATSLAAPALAADSLVVFSGRSDKFVKPVLDAFSKESGIKIVLHSAKSTALLNKLQVEQGRTEADVFISNDAGSLQAGSDMGLFQPAPESVARLIPANYKAADSSWLGLSARARVLVVNTKAKDLDFVKSVFDLADPRLKERLAITDSTNGSFIAGVTVYSQVSDAKQVKGWLNGMKANVNGKVFAKHSKIVKAVASGKKDIGLVNHYYIYRHLDKHPEAPIRILLPDQGDKGMGVAWNVAGIAVSKYSKKSAAVEKLLAFLVSEKGQNMFARVNREYPVRPGVAASPEVPAAGSYKVADVPMAQLGKDRKQTIDLLEAVGMP
jgi:iron(III) transport system substrate-binding protein